ncbi:hypothetical protein C8A03DRAFT_15674 [Achaetomium macrosporum]|uniref:DNA 3'-5' helicase n=1 Tax=Achaetomium macrosporum TaxID=79813 RepID=A0AAN7CAG3_9PEZI|nr:hypothetical protein C8A03DRAFT_15674 [Achaetomium macrosporum]
MGTPYDDGLDDFGPASSSPTARLSARKQQNAARFPGRLTPTLDTSSPIQSPPDSRRSSHLSTPVIHGIPLVSLRQALPDKCRAIFPYELLNAVQSKCFDVVYSTNDNLVVSAPTGSGKTAILELAICKLALDRGNENFKIVYQAPTKALCSEKARDWEKKFSHMSLKCAELTGDTSQAEMRRVGDASIIVTTPEKWDSITRKWHDHRKLLQMVELFLIDEAHILKDARGATLEAVVSRMKTIGANVRFIALSATVPNSEDIARWLGRNHTNQQLPAHREIFGEEFRPVKLQKFVYGFEFNSNDFMFDRFLSQKLPGIISKHTRQKPVLVFCFTRKSCENTAVTLAEFASGRPDGERLWPVPSSRVPVYSKELQEIVKYGVAFHHAGLDAQDRATVEQNFLKGQLGVICCTSTLAVGINLPCHTVVLKGTVGFTDERLVEYSDLEVMQMLGRAGRPQFDDSATAIILTRAANKERYQKMVSGQEILESTLHLNLIEHLNSEICLGTIYDLASARRWLGGTFLSVRLRKNPNYYQLTGGTTSPSQIDERLEEICERDIKQLQDAELVTRHDALRCTEYGRAMSKYMVEFSTMKLLLQIPRAVGMEALITILSQANEFKEFRFKQAERPLFREINQSPLIMYPIKEAVTQTRHKVSLMIQAHLGCVQYPDSSEAAKLRRQLVVERQLIFERLNRLVRAVIDCKGHDRDSVGTRTALELARALAAGSWEGRATQLTQVPNIGPVGMRKLSSKDIRTVMQLADKTCDEIERLMSRQPPYGRNLLMYLDKFPRLDMDLAIVGQRFQAGSEEPVVLAVKATLRYLNRKGPPNWLGRIPALTFLAETLNGTLVYFWRGSMRTLCKEGGHELTFSVGLRETTLDSHIVQIACHFSCEEIVGSIVSKTLKHKLSNLVLPSRVITAGTGFSTEHSKEANQDVAREASQEEYLQDDDIDDLDLIMAAEQASAQPSIDRTREVSIEEDTDEYPPLEELLVEKQATDKFDSHLACADDGELTSEPKHVQLPNGKWQCNHACAGGIIIKAGRPCNHRCCKEGVSKPPKQGPKRKREEAKEDLPGAKQMKKPRNQQQQDWPAVHPVQPSTQNRKVQTRPVLTQPASRPLSSGSVESPKNVDLDSMDLECIDLTFPDTDEEDLWEHMGRRHSSEGGGSVHNEPNIGGASNAENPEGSHPQHVRVSSRHSIPSMRLQGEEASTSATPPLPSQQGSYEEDLDIDGISLLEVLSPLPALTPTSTTSAFKPGASDEALYPGISGGFARTEVDSLPSTADENTTVHRERNDKPDNSSPSCFLDSVPEATSDTSPGNSSATENVTSPMGDEENAAETTHQAIENQAQKTDEPAWLAEFDQEFVDFFRGYVTFV